MEVLKNITFLKKYESNISLGEFYVFGTTKFMLEPCCCVNGDTTEYIELLEDAKSSSFSIFCCLKPFPAQNFEFMGIFFTELFTV
jgi:hypothetical protein